MSYRNLFFMTESYCCIINFVENAGYSLMSTRTFIALPWVIRDFPALPFTSTTGSTCRNTISASREFLKPCSETTALEADEDTQTLRTVPNTKANVVQYFTYCNPVPI